MKNPRAAFSPSPDLGGNVYNKFHKSTGSAVNVRSVHVCLWNDYIIGIDDFRTLIKSSIQTDHGISYFNECFLQCKVRLDFEHAQFIWTLILFLHFFSEMSHWDALIFYWSHALQSSPNLNFAIQQNAKYLWTGLRFRKCYRRLIPCLHWDSRLTIYSAYIQYQYVAN